MIDAASITPIVSPVNLPLTVASFRGTEGLSLHNECRIHEVALTWQQLADHFECESNSTQLSEHIKHQRDVSEKDARVKGVMVRCSWRLIKPYNDNIMTCDCVALLSALSRVKVKFKIYVTSSN